MRCWLVVPVCVIAALLLGFGCATKVDESKAAAPKVEPVPVTITATPAVYKPDMTHTGDPLPEGVLVWDSLLQSVDAAADQAEVHFTFNFTNIAKTIQTQPGTNVTSITHFTTVTNSGFWSRFWGNRITQVASFEYRTNLATVTNSITLVPVTILSVHPSCGCTTVQLPQMPWTVAAGTNGQIGTTVNLAGKTGTLLKTLNVVTDKGKLDLMMRITILPPVVPVMTDSDRARALAAAKADRQAVFHGDCVTCHVKPGIGKYGKALYEVSCGICHEAEHRASMVPDLHTLKTPTNEDFWRTWIMHGKPGTLMPAFSSAEGGPLNDAQISSLADYLNTAIPSKAPAPPQ